jgi:SAM-dependent methyltransferase
MTAATTADGFLGGRLLIHQPVAGYRAGTDAVLLAAAVPARAGDRVLELGCGVGTAALCLMARVPGLSVTGVERQPDYADLARRNASENGLPLQVVTADLARLPAGCAARASITFWPIRPISTRPARPAQPIRAGPRRRPATRRLPPGSMPRCAVSRRVAGSP